MSAHRAFGSLMVGAVVVVACQGCSNSDTSAPSRTAEKFVASVQGGDGRAACALLTDQARTATQGMTDQPCAALVVDLQERGREVRRAQVWGDTAQVRIGSDVLFLRRIDSVWRISAAGCSPRPHRPYDCEVQG